MVPIQLWVVNSWAIFSRSILSPPHGHFPKSLGYPGKDPRPGFSVMKTVDVEAL